MKKIVFMIVVLMANILTASDSTIWEYWLPTNAEDIVVRYTLNPNDPPPVDYEETLSTPVCSGDWGESYIQVYREIGWEDRQADINRDGVVNFLDYTALAEHWLEEY